MSQPHLVSLVLQSKKALQYGEQLCSKAHGLSNASAQCAVDVLALDAKVKWISHAVIQQLKLAASVAKSIEFKRAQLDKQIREWDVVRTERTAALDAILEALGTQLVPPGFHQSSTSGDSSLFGSHHSHDGVIDPTQSPSATVRENAFDKQRTLKHLDRSNWKTLRDFVDDSAIEEAMDELENDRTRLDDVMAATFDFPVRLAAAVASIRDALPASNAPPPIEALLAVQERTTTGMARHLESLASHYDQMANALHDSEGGVSHTDEEMQAMNRDTDELPAIMAELEQDVDSIQDAHDKLALAKTVAQEQLDASRRTLDSLDELGDIMSDMIQKQQDVELDCQDLLEGLQQRLLVVEDLHHRYVHYQFSFNNLLIEIARRRQYREGAEKIVERTLVELRRMTDDEQEMRKKFKTEHGDHIPDDICLCVENQPTKWEVVPCVGDVREVLPEIDEDLVVQARAKLAEGEMFTPSSDSV